jgi:hypothetical protein
VGQNDTFWRKCSSCKKEINLKAKYYECSVSTCTGQRTGYVFCSVMCWERHLPGAKHRNAGAIEKQAPNHASQTDSATENKSNDVFGSISNQEVNSAHAEASGPRRVLVQNIKSTASAPAIKALSQEVLVVVSKLKQYIRDQSEMNTSEDVNQKLSDFIRIQCDRAIESAKADGRKTVMARDFKV